MDDYENPRVRRLRGKTMAQVDGPKTTCKCDAIMAKDPTRHFRGCPKRAEYPTHEAEKTTVQLISSLYPVTRDLVHAILLRAVAFDGWSLQGFGMFRLYLSKSVRLHVWDDRFRTEKVTTIHSHPWHFRSTVIAGKMTDRLYEVTSFGFKSPTHHRQQIVCGPGGGATGAQEDVHVELLQEITIEPGASYSLTAEAFHESIPEPGTVTIIEREFLPDTEHAYVCIPYGEKWISAEPRKATMREVEAMAERALARLS